MTSDIPTALFATFSEIPGTTVMTASMAGFLLGLVHFGSLWWNARLYAGGGMLRSLLLQAARFAVLGGALTFFSHFGALALLAAAMGLLVARGVVLRRVGSRP